MEKTVIYLLAVLVLLGGCGRIEGASSAGSEISEMSEMSEMPKTSSVMMGSIASEDSKVSAASQVSVFSQASEVSQTSEESNEQEVPEGLVDYYGITATREDAPGVFCRFFFGESMFTGWWGALSDFSIENITVLDGGDEQTIRFRVEYTVTPARYARQFSWYNPFEKGQYGNMKPSEVMTAEVTLSSINGLWMPVRDTLPKIHDMNDSHEPTSEYLGANELLNILLETEKYTYYSEASLVVDEDGKCEETKTLETVYAYRHSDKQVIPVIVDREDRQFWLMDRVGDTIVFGSNWVAPESSPCRSSLYVVDENTLTYKELPAIGYLAFCDQGFYYTGRYGPNQDQVLYFYDYESGINPAFPEIEISYGDDAYWYGGTMFCYYDGKVIWGDTEWDTDGVTERLKEWLTLDQGTGKVSEYVWK